MYYLIDSGVFERILIRQILGRGEAEDVAVGGAGTLQSPFTCTKIDERALKSFLLLRKTAYVHRNTRCTILTSHFLQNL